MNSNHRSSGALLSIRSISTSFTLRKRENISYVLVTLRILYIWWMSLKHQTLFSLALILATPLLFSGRSTDNHLFFLVIFFTVEGMFLSTLVNMILQLCMYSKFCFTWIVKWILIRIELFFTFMPVDPCGPGTPGGPAIPWFRNKRN